MNFRFAKGEAAFWMRGGKLYPCTVLGRPSRKNGIRIGDIRIWVDADQRARFVPARELHKRDSLAARTEQVFDSRPSEPVPDCAQSGTAL